MPKIPGSWKVRELPGDSIHSWSNEIKNTGAPTIHDFAHYTASFWESGGTCNLLNDFICSKPSESHRLVTNNQFHSISLLILMPIAMTRYLMITKKEWEEKNNWCCAQVISADPSEEDRKAVLDKKKILFIVNHEGAQICYCSNNGEYVQKKIEKGQISLLQCLKEYKPGNFLQNLSHLETINKYLTSANNY